MTFPIGMTITVKRGIIKNTSYRRSSMSTQSRTVRLLQNVLYPTYQLYAVMGSKQTAPRDGLRLAALTTMEWVRQRIQDDIPAELCQPGPEEYRAADDSNLPSLHLNRGYVVYCVPA